MFDSDLGTDEGSVVRRRAFLVDLGLGACGRDSMVTAKAKPCASEGGKGGVRGSYDC